MQMRNLYFRAMQSILESTHGLFKHCIPLETRQDIAQDIILKMLMKDDNYFKDYDHIKKWGQRVFNRTCRKYLKRRKAYIGFEPDLENRRLLCYGCRREDFTDRIREAQSPDEAFRELCRNILKSKGKVRIHTNLVITADYQNSDSTREELIRKWNINHATFRRYLKAGCRKLTWLMWEIYGISNYNNFRKE